MPRTALLPAACLTLLLALALPTHADSLASSASSAGSASSGSVSDSIGASSDSSTRDREVTEGEYRVLEVAEAPGRAGTARLKLRATGDGSTNEFMLYVPREAMAQRQLGTGDLVQVRKRPYGFEFAYDDTRRAFFLALNDDWYRELGSHAVGL
jgi:hypothetical protein